MAEQAVNVIFRGDIVLGQNLVEVKARFAQLFKLTPDKVDTYFSGRPVALKKSCDQATAEKFKQALQQIGCLVQIKPVEAETAAQAPAQSPVAQAVATQVTDNQSMANQAAVAPAPAPVASAAAIQEPAVAKPTAAPVEAPAAIDTSHLSLVKRNPFSTEDEEPLEPARVVTPPALDLSNYALEPVSDDWLEPARDVPELELDLSAISLDQVGADLLKPNELPQVTAVVVDVSGISIAAPGEDLGELAKPAAPPAPDTSHLSLN